MVQRVTHQRLAVLDVLKDNHDHPTASEVYALVRKQIPTCSRGTVYRQLDTLCNEGKIRAVPIAGTSRYESLEHQGHHDHFICKQCNHITDVHFDAMDKKALAVLAKKHPELQADQVIISWQGLCKSCQ